MKPCTPIIALLGAVFVLVATQGFAGSRSLRADNPGFDCYTPNWATVSVDPYGNLDGNGDGAQNPSTFFNSGTVVTPPAIFCTPTIAFSVGSFPPQGDSANPASKPVQNPDQDPIAGCFANTPQNCGDGPTIAALTAQGGVGVTGGVMYEWINATDTNLTPDAEVIVWTLPVSATLPNGALELEFDNWCSSNDNGTGAGPLLPPAPPPSFTWNGIRYEYLAGCANFYGDDLLLDPISGAIIGYVVNSTDSTYNTIVPGPTARGWQAMTTPGGLSAVTGSGSVTLNWTATTGATSYNIYQATTTGSEGNTPIKTGTTTSSAVISGLTNGHQYFFTVTAVYSTAAYSAGFESSQSSETSATVLAATPTGLTATASVSSIALKWNASSGASSYNVYQGPTSRAELATPIASGITTSSYTVNGLTAGQTYFFNVVAVDGGGKSAVSNEATTAVVAATPTGLSATAKSETVALSWSASTGATTYNIYQGTSSGGESTAAVSSVMATTATISGLSSGQTYYFKVAAVDAGGISLPSAEASATPTAPPPSSSGGGGSMGQLTLLMIVSLTLSKMWRDRSDLRARVCQRKAHCGGRRGIADRK